MLSFPSLFGGGGAFVNRSRLTATTTTHEAVLRWMNRDRSTMNGRAFSLAQTGRSVEATPRGVR